MKIAFTGYCLKLTDLYDMVSRLTKDSGYQLQYTYREFELAIGMTANDYAENVIRTATGLGADDITKTQQRAVTVYTDMFGTTVYIRADGLEDVTVTAPDDFRPENQNRHLSDVHPLLVKLMLEDYDEVGSDWVAEEGCPSWFALLASPEHIGEILAEFRTLTDGPIDDLLRLCGTNRTEACSMLMIPYRTMQQWCLGTAECKLYLRLYIAVGTGLIRLCRL